MKPVFFNTEEVRAVLDGRKTVTRRVVKPHPNDRLITGENALELLAAACAPYRPGDILYVRETFTPCCMNEKSRKGHSDFCYKASYDSLVYGCVDKIAPQVCKWSPSIHMPREAARIFLRVTDVWVEKLWDITDEQAIAEGYAPYNIAAGPEDWTDEPSSAYKEAPPSFWFRGIWDRTIKPADRALYGWEVNPWVWVIEFEKISREEAAQHDKR